MAERAPTGSHARPGAVARLRRALTSGAGRANRDLVTLVVTVGILTALGLIMTFSASFVRSVAETGDAFGVFRRHALWCAVGIPLMVGAALTDYRRWRRFAAPALIVSLALTALVLVPGIGVMAQGARRWIDLGPITFQPSELLKLGLVLYLAHVLARRWPRLRAGDLHGLLMPAVPVIAIASGLVLAGPDLETTVLLALMGGLVLYTAGLPGRIVGVGVSATVIVGFAAIWMTPFRRARLSAWLDPAAQADTFGYQAMQGFISLGSGGMFGRGLGQGRGQWLYVPNAHTDFIYAIIGEELGLLGAVFVLALFGALAVAGFGVARRAADPFGRLLAVGITGWLVMQAGMNMASVVGLLPVTGVTLPLVSFGGTSLVLTMLACGLLMSVARHEPDAEAAG